MKPAQQTLSEKVATLNKCISILMTMYLEHKHTDEKIDLALEDLRREAKKVQLLVKKQQKEKQNELHNF
jgi:hypothetical protein